MPQLRALPLNAPERMAAVQRTRLVDSPRESAFDLITQLAVELLDVPVAVISIVLPERQFFKAQQGLPEPWASGTPISHSFCRHVVETACPFSVEDARVHPVVRDNPAVVELGLVAYLGVPLTTFDHYVAGSLCAMDGQPRRWRDNDITTLRDLAASIRPLLPT